MGTGYIFMAEGVTPTSGKCDVDHETLDKPKGYSIKQARRLLSQNKFKLLAWSAALGMALNRMEMGPEMPSK